MKWIAIAQNEEDFKSLNFEDTLDVKYINIKNYRSYDGRKKFSEEIRQSTHVVFMDAKKIETEPFLMYAVGLCNGLHLPIFAVGFDIEEQVPPELEAATVFGDAKKLNKFIKDNLPEFIREENQHIAARTLYQMGIPLTATAFAKEIESNHLKECDLMLAAGMDINVKDSLGVPMICHCARKSNKETLIWLLDHGANIDAISDDRGYSAVMDAVWKTNDELVEVLVARGANLGFISRDGQSVLVLAIGSSNQKICEMLLDYGADPYVKDKMGMSAYDYAKLFHQDFLLKKIAEIEERKKK